MELSVRFLTFGVVTPDSSLAAIPCMAAGAMDTQHVGHAGTVSAAFVLGLERRSLRPDGEKIAPATQSSRDFERYFDPAIGAAGTASAEDSCCPRRSFRTKNYAEI